MKNKLIWYAVPVFLLVGYMFIQRMTIDNLRDEKQLQAVELSTLKDSVLVYKDKNGELTYKLNVIEVDHGNLKESLEMYGFEIKELKDKDIQWRKITAALKLQLEAAGHGEIELKDTIIIEKTDTLYQQNFKWNNNNLSLIGNIYADKLKFDYSYKTGIDFITTQQRKGTTVSVMLSDPNAKITTGNSIFVKDEKRFWNRWWFWTAIGVTGGVIITK